jgi:pimeloyl-ACP methyl ester carboxylesterase
VIMIGPYEAPLFAKNGWLTDLSTQYIASDPSYDASDLLPPVAKALSYHGDAQLITISGGPHAIPWTHAEQVNTALLQFVASATVPAS